MLAKVVRIATGGSRRDRLHQPLSGSEAVVDRDPRHARPAGDLAHADQRSAALRSQLPGGGHDHARGAVYRGLAPAEPVGASHRFHLSIQSVQSLRPRKYQFLREGSAGSPTAVPSPTGTRIGTLANLRAHGFLNFQDSARGDPAVAIALSSGSVVAFDAICTHAGCQVDYDSGQRLLPCPCHGALFDPSHGAAVVAGPAPTPLAAIRVEVASDGGVYAG